MERAGLIPRSFFTMSEENNFERLRAIVEEHNPKQLSRFDALVHKMKNLDQDDEILLLLEATGFLSLAYNESLKDLESSADIIKSAAEDLQLLPSTLKGKSEAKLAEVLNSFDAEAKMSIEYFKAEVAHIEDAKNKAADAVKYFEQIKTFYLAKLGIAFVLAGGLCGAALTYLLMK